MADKREKVFWRIVAICGLCLLLFSTIRHIVSNDYINVAEKPDFFPGWVSLLLNIVSAGVFFYLCFKPLVFELYGTMSFLYSVLLLVDTTGNPMGFFMYLLFMICFYKRGYFRTHKKQKYTTFIVVFFLLICTQCRYGRERFINSILTMTGYILITAVIISLLKNEILHYNSNRIIKTLDLTKYTELKQRDKEWISLALQETKYETVAETYAVSVGTVKNRMRKIYKIINIPDRIGLLAEYGGYNVICTEEEKQEWKKKIEESL